MARKGTKTTAGALRNVRIVDLTQIWAGPLGSKILADMGAEVIKVEAARRYDNARNYGSLPNDQLGERPYNRRALFNNRNRNKMGVTLDLKTDKGKAIFRDLVAISDVVMENYSARVMGNFGLEYDALRDVRPDIVMISMPAFGRTGPEKDYIGQGSNLTPLAGMVAVTGYQDSGPQQIGAYTDPVAGVSAVGAVMAALLYRQKTGRGQYIDLAQREVSARFIGEAVLDHGLNGRIGGPQGNRQAGMAPHGCYPSKGEDEWVAIAVSSDQQWLDLCSVTGHPEWADDPRFSSSSERLNNQDELDPLIAGWTQQRDKYEIMPLLQQADIACGPVLTAGDLVDRDPHMEARGFFWKTSVPDAPDLGVHSIPGALWKFSKTPATLRSPAPRLGEHNDLVYGELLGISDDLEALETEGITGTEPLVREGMWVSGQP